MKRLLFPLLVVLLLAACAAVPVRLDPACPDNLVFVNGEELPGALQGIDNQKVAFVLLDGARREFPAAEVLRIDLGHRVGDPRLKHLTELNDLEILRLIEEAKAAPPETQQPVTHLLFEHRRRLDDDGVWRGVYRRLLQINTQKGLSWANETFTYNERTGTAQVDFGYAIAPDGRLSVLSTGAVRNTSLGDGRPDGSRQRRLQIAVPDAQVGGFVYFQFSFARRTSALYPFQHARTVANVAPMRVVRSIVDLPADVEAVVVERRLAEARYAKSDLRRDGRRIITYQFDDPPQLLDEPGMPAWNAVAPYFLIAKKTTWAALADAYWQGWQERVTLTDALRAKAAELTADQPPADAARALYEFVLRDVRDNGVSLWERDPLPKPPADTLAEMRGNIVDRTALLAALAQAAGLNATPCFVSPAFWFEPLDEAPLLQSASVMLLRFDLPAGPRWTNLDDDSRLFGRLSFGTADSFFLELPTGRTGRTPALAPAEHAVESSYDVYLEPGGAAKIVEERRFTGNLAQSLRGYRHYDPERLRDRMRAEVSGFGQRTKLLDFSLDGMGALTDPVVLRRTSHSPMFTVAGGSRYELLRLFDFGLSDLYRVHERRLYPLERLGLTRERRVYRFHLPPGLTVKNLPAPVQARVGDDAYTYTASWTLAGSLLTFTDETIYAARELPPERFGEAEEFFHQRRLVGEGVLLLEPR